MSGFFKRQEERYFSNSTSINKFSEMIIQNLTSFKIIKKMLKENNIFKIEEIEKIEHQAFNLLINQIELEKGNSKVEVGVIGSFSSGKSTFINSLFGEPICPMAVRPTTSSITKFYYGYKEKITIDGEEITQEEYHNLAQHSKEKDNQKLEIEYAYPFERFNSIILYDTPGFNNNLNKNDSDTTMKVLKSVDVIFFIVDISKGAIDKSSIERLRLPELKNKRMYCILNKSDLKSEQAIAKIKSEIVSQRLFMEVIEYSASKVLEWGERDYLSEHFKYIKEQLLSKKIDFTTIAKGVLTKSKGRVKTKVEYKLHLDSHEYIIDDFYITSKVQRARVEKMLNIISQSKQFTLKQKLQIEVHNYHQKSLYILKEILKNLKIENTTIPKLEVELNNFIREKKSYVKSLQKRKK